MSVHKAEPGNRPYNCRVCGQRIQAVPGGQGTTYIHSDSGAVAAPNPDAIQAIKVAGVLISVYVKDGVLVISTDFDESELGDPTPVVVRMSGETVWSAE